MTISVSQQAYIFLCSILGGMAIAFIYDIFRIKRKTIKTNNMITFIEDIVYWIIVALVMFGVVYYSNEGEMRGYILIGTVIGVILYALLLSRIVVKIFVAIIHIVCRIVKGTFNIVIYPFKILYRILRVPGKFISKIFMKGFRKSKHFGKRNLSKGLQRLKIVRNAIKKF